MESPPPAPYILVTTSAGVRSALKMLSASRFLLFDCEGEKLGCEGGALSLLSVGTELGDIFVFDALALGRETLLRVIAFIADGRRRKFVWDGRKDYSELRHSYRHRLENVIDLQLTDIVSRAVRRHGPNGERLLLEAEARCPAIHHLLSLKRVLFEHELSPWTGGTSACQCGPCDRTVLVFKDASRADHVLVTQTPTSVMTLGWSDHYLRTS